MSRKAGYTYPLVGLEQGSEAWDDVLRGAEDYGLSAGEFIRLLVVSWSKMRRGQWNPLWGQPLPGPGSGAATATLASASPHPAQESEAERARREEEARRKRIRLAAAAAETDELLV